MELSKVLRDYSRTIAGKEQLLISAIAKALEIIPRQLCDNAGFDATNILNKLRQKHAQGKYSHLRILMIFSPTSKCETIRSSFVHTLLFFNEHSEFCYMNAVSSVDYSVSCRCDFISLVFVYRLQWRKL